MANPTFGVGGLPQKTWAMSSQPLLMSLPISLSLPIYVACCSPRVIAPVFATHQEGYALGFSWPSSWLVSCSVFIYEIHSSETYFREACEIFRIIIL